jgi:hypothetical protein
MPGFNNGVVWADNVRFDGTGYPGAVTTDGQLLIGSTASPNIRVGTITATAGTGVGVTAGAGSLVVAGIDSTTLVKGVIQLATDPEAIAGADSAKAIVSTSLKAKLGSQTANAFVYGTGDNLALGWTGAATDGQLLIGKTGLAPVAASLTAGTGIGITPGAGTISIAAAASVATSYDGDSGTATPSGNNLDIVGATATGGTATNIVTSGATNVMSIALKNSISQPTTNAAGTGGVYSLGGNRFLHNFASTGVALDNTFLGNNAGNLTNTGKWSTVVGGESGSVLTSGQYNTILGSNSSQALTTGEKNTVVGAYNFLSAIGASNNVVVGYCAGTNATSASSNVFVGDHAGYYDVTAGFNVFVGSYAGEKMIGGDNVGIGNQACRGGNAATSTGQYNVAVGSNSLEKITTGGDNCAIGVTSQRLVTTGSFNTSLASSSLDKLLTGWYNISIGYVSGRSYTGAESSNVIIQNEGVVGESNTIRIGTQGAGNRQENRCFIAGITGVTVSNTALVTLDTTTGQLGTKTIANLPSWTVISADQPAVVGAGYFCNKVGLLSLSLPAASAVGNVIEVSNINTAVGTVLTQGAGQQIYYGSLSTTLGAGGSLTSIAVGDSLKIVCRVADTFWQVVSSVGSWTVV